MADSTPIYTSTITLDITLLDSEGGTYTFKINNPMNTEQDPMTLTKVKTVFEHAFSAFNSSGIDWLRRYSGTMSTYFTAVAGAKISEVTKVTRELT